MVCITTSDLRTGANGIISTPLEILISSPYDKRGLLIGIASELHASGADLGDWTRGNGLFVSLSFAKHIDSWCEGWTIWYCL